MLLTVSMVGLGVPRSQGVNLAEGLEIIYGELIAQKMKDDVLKSAATAGDWIHSARTIKRTYA